MGRGMTGSYSRMHGGGGGVKQDAKAEGREQGGQGAQLDIDSEENHASFSITASFVSRWYWTKKNTGLHD
jgi:hypothetical protein